MARTESNNANVYPLPRPPAPPRHVSSRQSDGQSIKGQWQKGKLLGRGTYGSVYEAINRYVIIYHNHNHNHNSKLPSSHLLLSAL